MHKTGIDLTEILIKETNAMTSSFLLPETTMECNMALRKAKRDVTDIIEKSFEGQRK
jgi:hypothetical protein